MNLFQSKRKVNPDTLQTPEEVPPIQQLPDYETVVPGVSPSEEQRRVLGFVEHGSGDAIVEAVAGSGKTKTLLGCARQIPEGKKCLICAFNKSVQRELSQKVSRKRTDVKTFHSFGRSILKEHIEPEINISRDKRGNVVGDVLREQEIEEDGVWSTVVELSRLAQETLTSPSNPKALRQMAAKYGYGREKWDPRFSIVLEKVIARMSNAAIEEGIVSFAEMIYIPVIRNYIDRKYDWVLVDEAQDLNNAQQELTFQACNEDGRRLYVGDRRQAINGFQGADPDSIDHIQERTDAIELELTTCFRCPSTHVSKAQEIVPEIRPASSAEDGNLEYRPLSELPSIIEENDLVLCRTRKHLVKWCLQVPPATRVPAYVEKGNLKEMLQRLISRALEQAPAGSAWSGTRDALLEGLNKCRDNPDEISKDQGFNSEIVKEEINAIEEIAKEREWEDAEELKSIVGGFFQASPEAARFTTIHKAKGQENRRVLVIKPALTPDHENDPKWQEKQEENLKYVMRTRSTDTLVLLNDGGKDTGGDISTSGTNEGYMRIPLGEIKPGDRVDHIEHGVGEVVTTEKGPSSHIIMRFPQLRNQFRDVNISEPVLKETDEELPKNLVQESTE